MPKKSGNVKFLFFFKPLYLFFVSLCLRGHPFQFSILHSLSGPKNNSVNPRKSVSDFFEFFRGQHSQFSILHSLCAFVAIILVTAMLRQVNPRLKNPFATFEPFRGKSFFKFFLWPIQKFHLTSNSFYRIIPIRFVC